MSRAAMKRKPPPRWVRDGALVWYSPVVRPGEPRYAGVVDGEAFQLGDGSWVAHLREMEPAYGARVHAFSERLGESVRTRVVAACMFALTERRP